MFGFSRVGHPLPLLTLGGESTRLVMGIKFFTTESTRQYRYRLEVVVGTPIPGKNPNTKGIGNERIRNRQNDPENLSAYGLLTAEKSDRKELTFSGRFLRFCDFFEISVLGPHQITEPPSKSQ